MKKIFSAFLSLLFVISLICTPAISFAGRKASRSSSHSSRPYYGGGHHTYSHGGRYSGGSGGSSHKGGHYRNARTGNRYGRHK